VKLQDKIKKLKPGRSFYVKSETERKEALKIAGILDFRIRTEIGARGFRVTRVL
jgi:hypothetical protein